MFKILRSISSRVKNSNYSSITMEKTEDSLKDLTKKRYDGRIKKRKWEERRSDYQTQDINKKERITDEKFERIKKRKYAMLLAYSGLDYYGMQRNPQTQTVEEDLFKALLAANYISPEAFEQVQQIQFQRAARTDKGVSASRQIVSIKLPEEISISSINSHLPEAIRVFGIKRATKGFNSKSACDARTYSYTLPTVAFYGESNSLATWREYRIGAELRETLTAVLEKYIGTNNYHNFTSKKKSQDPSAKRYIMSFVAGEAVEIDGVEFITLKVKGQSFMLHQIRKMVGLCIAICRKHTSLATLSLALSSVAVNVPRAPGLGLVLDRVHYDRYDQRYGADGVHCTLTGWEECDKEVEEFTQKHIRPTIVKGEVEGEGSMITWLETLDRHTYDRVEGEEDPNDANDNEDDDNKDDQHHS